MAKSNYKWRFRSLGNSFLNMDTYVIFQEAMFDYQRDFLMLLHGIFLG